MPLLPPRVLGPISECSVEVTLQGTVTGADVEITAATLEFTGGTEREIRRERIARGRAESSEQSFRFSRGVTLNPGQIIRATQRIGDDAGLGSLDGIRVMPRPVRELIGAIIWAHRISEGSHCVWLEGAWPGAIVEVKDSDGHTLAQQQTIGPVVRLTLERPVRSREVLTATQVVCGIRGPDSVSSIATPLPRNFELPPPTVGSPLFECQRRVLIDDVIPGLAVRVMRMDLPTVEVCFDATDLYVPYSESEHLRTGEIITAQQGFPELGMWSALSASEKVLSARRLPRPRIIQPLCANADRIVATNLEPDAIVRVFVNGSEVGYATAVSSTDSFLLPPLPGGGTIYITQELCGFVSERSEEITLSMRADVSLFSITPTSECSPVIHVSGLWSGVRVRLIAPRSFPPLVLGDTTALSNEVTFHVPTLSTNLSYAVEVSSPCLRMRYTSFVPLGTEFFPPSFGFYILHCDRAIPVTKVRSGAFVDVYINDEREPRGSAFVTSTSVEVPIVGRLNPGDRVKAIQRLCGHESGPSEDFVKSCHHIIRVGPKVLDFDPRFISSVLDRLEWMRRLYRYHGFEVEYNDVEWINRPELAEIDERIETGRRGWGQLLAFRDGLSANDIALYFVRNIAGTSDGFSRVGQRWGISKTAGFAPLDNTAHEAGHALGLPHPTPCPRNDIERVIMLKRLMMGDPCFRRLFDRIRPGNNPTGTGTTGSADEALFPTEVETMKRSRYARAYRA